MAPLPKKGDLTIEMKLPSSKEKKYKRPHLKSKRESPPRRLYPRKEPR
jgi:hypothetical protein